MDSQGQTQPREAKSEVLNRKENFSNYILCHVSALHLMDNR